MGGQQSQGSQSQINDKPKTDSRSSKIEDDSHWPIRRAVLLLSILEVGLLLNTL